MALTSPFVKLSTTLNFVDVQRSHLKSEYGALKYYLAIGNPLPFDVLKVLLPDIVRWVELDDKAYPHRDDRIIASMNYYFDPDGGTTTFWKMKPGAETFLHKSTRTTKLYRERDLVVGPSFTANAGDLYLLNNTEIHSVELPMGKLRRFIQLAWFEMDFDNVLQVVIDSGQFHVI